MIAAQNAIQRRDKTFREAIQYSRCEAGDEPRARISRAWRMPPKFPDENLLFLEHRRALFIKKDCAFELAEIRGLIRWNLHLPHHIALSRCGRWLAKSVSTS